ncbi:MAG: hypothetical protein ACKO0N_08440 [Planctomycetota bacterium]
MPTCHCFRVRITGQRDVAPEVVPLDQITPLEWTGTHAAKALIMTTETAKPKADGQKASRFVQVPRWVISFQVALLTVLPLSCFLLGFAAARLSQPERVGDKPKTNCLISGRIESVEGTPEPSVILLLPLNQTPSERLNPTSLNPSSFQAVGNSAIEAIQRLGGGVTRTSDSGAFRLEVESPGRYLLVATSFAESAAKANGPTLTRETTAELSRFFLPVERLFEGHRVQTLQINATGEELDLGSVPFVDLR